MAFSVERPIEALRQSLVVDPDAPPSSALVLKLRRRDSLSLEEEKSLEALIPPPGNVSRTTDIVSEGHRPTSSALLVDGFAARYKVLDHGGRQITAVHVPGDFVDLHSLLLKEMDHGVVALTDCRVSRVPHDRLRHLTETHPHLARLFWLSTLIDGSIHREWLVNMGRRTAQAHMANFFCEIYCLLEIVWLAPDFEFFFPITQNDLADILGLSLVHVNRTLQELRAADLLEWRGGKLKILNWNALRKIAEFDGTYLQLRAEPR